MTIIKGVELALHSFRGRLHLLGHRPLGRTSYFLKVCEASPTQILIKKEKILYYHLVLLEPGVAQGLMGGGSLAGIRLKHHLEEVPTSLGFVSQVVIDLTQIADLVVLQYFYFIRSSEEKADCHKVEEE